MRSTVSHIVRAGAVFIVVLGVVGGGLMSTLTGRSGAATPAAHRIGSAPRLPHGARVTGHVRSGRSLSLVVALKPNDPAALAAYATAVSTPGSSEYKQYLTVAQFRQRFAPSNAQIQAVRSSLSNAGLAPGSVSANGLLIDVTASAAKISTAFNTTLQQVHLVSGRTAYANTAAPQLSGSVAGLVQGVIGLDNLSVPHALGLERAQRGTQSRVLTASRASAVSAHASAPTCAAATSASDSINSRYGISSYTADQIASAYGFTSLYDEGDLGAGQTVALIEFTRYSSSDVNEYESCYGTDNTVNILHPAGSGTPDDSGEDEAVLDIEQIMGLAPQATIDVYEAEGNDTGSLDDYGAIVDADQAKVISTSWGVCEPSTAADTAYLAAENELFEEAAAQGQSVYAASGDDGSSDCNTDTTQDSELAVDDPGSQPYVTSVGGTSLPSSSTPSTQTTWNDSSDGDGAGGGGISSLWDMPNYQTGAASSLRVINSASSNTPCGQTAGGYCREVPDVSADADPETGYVIYDDGSWTVYGGTSAAAPLWAALTAVANASSYCGDGANPIGLANPVLYDVADSEYASAFTDITAGNNDYTPSGYTAGSYAAGTGYDMATGLGTPIAGTLVPDMCAASRSTTVSFPAVTATAGTTTTSTTPTCTAATHTLRKGADKLGLRNRHRSAKLTLSATVASNCSSDKLSFQVHVTTAEAKHARAKDTLKVQILSSSGKTLATLKTLSNRNAARGYKTITLNVKKWAGKRVKVRFLAREGGHKSTSFTVRAVKLSAA